MRPAAWRFLAGASAANLSLTCVWGVLFQYRSPDAFFLMMAPRDVVAVCLNVGLGGAAAVAIGAALDRWRSGLWLRTAGVGVLGVVTCLGNGLRQGLHLAPGMAGGDLGLGLIAMALLGLGVCWLLNPEGLLRWSARLMLMLSPFLLLTVPRSLWIGTAGGLVERFGDSPRRTPFTAGRPVHRVVWVIFDELDYRLAFASRPPGVLLPAFDRLKEESLSADSAWPPASNTNESLPGSLTGIRVGLTEGVTAREGRLQLQSDSGWVSTDSVTTVFQRARALHANSAMVGWNLPYCRSGLGSGLVRCLWSPSGLTLGLTESLVGTMWRQWVAASLVNSRVIYRTRLTRLVQEGLRQVADSALDLVVLHLPIPHQPWVFDAGTGRFTLFRFSSSGYLDNLVLADRILARIRLALEDSRLGPRTALLLTSDHAWRESSGFDGRSDPRVPFLIHLPWAPKSVVVARPFNAIQAGGIALALLADSALSVDSLGYRLWSRPGPK